jgi:ribosomal protein L37E
MSIFKKINNSVRYCDRCGQRPYDVKCGDEKLCLKCAQKAQEDDRYLRITLDMTTKPERRGKR